MDPLRPLVAAILAGGLTLAPPEASAQDEEAPVILPDLVVTPLRGEAERRDVPYAAHDIRLDLDIPRSTPEALAGQPSVLIQKTSHAQGSPFLRGFTGFRTLMLVDGIRLNHAAFREGPNQYWTTVDPWAVERYELVLGPGSVLYGSDAVGGTVNAIGKGPPAWTGDPEWTRRVMVRTATAERSHQGRLEVSGRPSERVGVQGGITLKNFGDLEGGRDTGRQLRTGYEEHAYDLRLDLGMTDHAWLILAHQHLEQDDAWRTHRTPPSA